MTHTIPAPRANRYANAFEGYLTAQAELDRLNHTFDIRPETPLEEYPAAVAEKMAEVDKMVRVCQMIDAARWERYLLSL